ncbi:hypothetical protein [Rodentibacter caecimuris]|uniref:hypothetical protein n=1 Tax=Rodentibacter caecimuris TaxID=1796644 RepID=UPI001442A3E2|nr:hypothetical protein [Pasteurella caecimuris]
MIKEEILAQQRQLKLLFSVWMKEKMKHEVVTFQKRNGTIVEHYPDGSEKIVGYAK